MAYGIDTIYDSQSGEKITFDVGSNNVFDANSSLLCISKDAINKVSRERICPRSLWGGYVEEGRRSGSKMALSTTAEGYNVIASATCAHAEGQQTEATERYSHAEGLGSIASGASSHAEGQETKASNITSHAEGYKTEASNICSHASGKFSKSMAGGTDVNNQLGDAFIIGNGTSEDSLSNAFRVTFGGATYGLSAFNSSGADYAEFICPWADGNMLNEDRVGYFVTVKDGFLHKANAGEYIAGVISGNPSIVGNSDEDYYWKYARDEFNRTIWEDVPEIKEVLDEEEAISGDNARIPVMRETGNIIKNARMKLDENYDSSLQDNYIERKDRPEWDYVGMLGVLPVRDDGTCVPGQFCKCADGGIATFSSKKDFDTYMVIERVTDNVVKVILK